MNLKALEQFISKEMPLNNKSIYEEYVDDISFLLEKGYNIKQIYRYLKEQYNISKSMRALYYFVNRKNLNNRKEEKKEVAIAHQLKNQKDTSVKEKTYIPTIKNKKEDFNKSNELNDEDTEILKPKAASNPDEAKKSNTEQNREKYKVTINEYKKYLEIYEKGITSLDPERNPKLSKDEFAKVMKMLYRKHHKTFDDLYELYKTIFKEGRYKNFKKNEAEANLIIFFHFANKDNKIELQQSINSFIPPFRPWEKISDFGWDVVDK